MHDSVVPGVVQTPIYLPIKLNNYRWGGGILPFLDMVMVMSLVKIFFPIGSFMLCLNSIPLTSSLCRKKWFISITISSWNIWM